MSKRKACQTALQQFQDSSQDDQQGSKYPEEYPEKYWKLARQPPMPDLSAPAAASNPAANDTSPVPQMTTEVGSSGFRPPSVNSELASAARMARTMSSWVGRPDMDPDTVWNTYR